MAVFDNCSVLFELKNLPFKEKKKLKSAVTDHGGSICFVVNKQCSLIVTSDVSSLSANRLRSIQKYQTPVVGVDYVLSCVERGVLLPVDEYKLDTAPASASSPPLPLFTLKPSPRSHHASRAPPWEVTAEPSSGPAKTGASDSLAQRPQTIESNTNILEKFRIYTETDSDLPLYPDNFQVAKYSIYKKVNSNTWCVLELQSFKGKEGWRFRVVQYRKDDVASKKAAAKDKLVFLSTSEEALEVYKALRETMQATGLQLTSSIPPQAQDLGSAPLQQLLLEEKLNTGSLSQEVGVFVELLWTEALGCLSNILRVPVNKLSLNDVSRAEGLLLLALKKLKEANLMEATSLLTEVYTLLPLKQPLPLNTKLISQNLDLCQLIRDVLNVSEMTLRSPVPSCLGKYRALRCSIETVPPGSPEFQSVTTLLQDSKLQIKQVLRLSRGVEQQTFKSDLGNIKPLLHSTNPSNIVGVLSRGLLLPRVGVEHHGIERTDAGNLGSGIYFSDAASTSIKYSRPSKTDGSRLLLVCDVALGQCVDFHKRDLTLTHAPEGHHSVHGVRRTPNTPSEFQDDEYVVYSPDQVKLKYVVQFSIEGDQVKGFSPDVVTSAEPCLPPSDQQEPLVEDSSFESIKNPLEDVKAGLLDSSGQQLPLQAVHIKCKLVDLLSQVIIFQKYTNKSSVPIEAKYVFPLDDSAAVCGFEAFIDGKHVVGQVKEKETARKEYKQAIEKGHGAYLMDQDAPDVFTISVGNLPPSATVLIKVTFVSELIVRDGSILFALPGSVAPWQESAALNQTTQVTVEKVCVTDEAASTRDFSLDVSVEMPHEIKMLTCITHKVKTKRTDCKAVVSVMPGEVLGSEGFQLSITLSEVHLPRMWVEKHPDKDSQACMLVFYPDFDVNPSSASDEVVLLLDTSESMKGESLRTAQGIALQVLKTLNHQQRLNVIFFGTDHTEAFLTAQPLAEARQAAQRFITRSSPVGGCTELWRPLRALSLLPPSCGVRNLLLLSDGHIQNAELTLQLLRDNVQHSRLFTCGLSPTANRHMLRALAQAGGGAFEFFDTKTKHNWAEKVACQVRRMASPGCSSVAVKWQQFNPTAPLPVQAPKQLHALFNNCHTLVYGFVPHCTQATLLGNLSGQELQTMVSTSDLQKTRGTFLHKLTARALIRDYEDGTLDASEAEHEGKKVELKRFIIELSKEFSILSQFTSFVAIEERDSEQTKGFTDIHGLIAEEDVDFLPYVSWISPEHTGAEYKEEFPDLADFLDTGEFDCIGYSYECEDNEDDVYTTSSEGGEELGGVCEEEEEYLSIKQASDLKETSHYPLPLHRNSVCYSSRSAFSSAPVLPRLASSFAHDGPVLSSPASLTGRPRSALLIQAHHSSSPQSACMNLTPVDCSAISALAPPRPSSVIREITQSLAPPPPPPASIAFCGSIPSFLDHPAPPPPSSVFPDMTLSMVAPPPPPLDSPVFCSSSSPFPDPPAPPSPSGLFGYASSRRHTSAIFGQASPAFLPTTPSVSFGRNTKKPMRLRAGREVEVLSRLQTNTITSLSSDQSFPHQEQTQQQRSRVGSSFKSFKKMKLGKCSYLDSIPSAVDLRKDMTVQSKSTKAAFAQTELASDEVSPCEPQESVAVSFRLRRSRSQPRHCSLSAVPESPKLRWTKIFQIQHSEGYWELTTELGELINVNVDHFANVFLKSKGIQSLGVRAHTDILRLVATLLVLQLMRVEKLEEGKLLRTLFCLDTSCQLRPERCEEVKKAVDWACWADRQYPCVYSRLEFGSSWESSTRQLLGYDSFPPFSSLSSLNLQRTSAPLWVH